MISTRLSDLARGVVRLELIGAYPAGVLNAAAAACIEIWDTESRGENTLRFCLYEKRLAELKTLAERGDPSFIFEDRISLGDLLSAGE